MPQVQASAVMRAVFLCGTTLLQGVGSVWLARAQEPKLESCRPASERTGEQGCWIVASTHVGVFAPGPVFWTLDRFGNVDNARAAAGGGATVVEALGQVWLFTVGGKITPMPGGVRVSQIGPIPVKANEDYTAQYREAILAPGAVSRTHLHSGPEIFYTETGETCLETPSGVQVSRKGADVIVPEGEAMELVATGHEMRRGLVLVLHSSAKPHTTLVSDWKAQGLCKEKH